MAEAKKSGIVAKAQKRLSRTKTKVLQTLGKADRSTDETFDDLVQKTEKQHDVAHHLLKEIKTYVHCMRALGHASKALATALSQTYEDDWTEEEDFKKGLESLDLLWEDYQQNIQAEVFEPMNTYIQSFPSLKNRVAKRGRKMVDYDNSRHNLEVLQQAKKKDDAKIAKAQEDLNESKRIFEELHNELITELPDFYNSRVTFYADLFQKLFGCERRLHSEITQVTDSLNQICQNLSKDYVQFVYQPKQPLSKSVSDNSDEPRVTNGEASPHQPSSASASPATTPTSAPPVSRTQGDDAAAGGDDDEPFYGNQEVVTAAAKVNGDVDRVKAIMNRLHKFETTIAAKTTNTAELDNKGLDQSSGSFPVKAPSQKLGDLSLTATVFATPGTQSAQPMSLSPIPFAAYKQAASDFPQSVDTGRETTTDPPEFASLVEGDVAYLPKSAQSLNNGKTGSGDENVACGQFSPTVLSAHSSGAKLARRGSVSEQSNLPPEKVESKSRSLPAGSGIFLDKSYQQEIEEAMNDEAVGCGHSTGEYTTAQSCCETPQQCSPPPPYDSTVDGSAYLLFADAVVCDAKDTAQAPLDNASPCEPEQFTTEASGKKESMTTTECAVQTDKLVPKKAGRSVGKKKAVTDLVAEDEQSPFSSKSRFLSSKQVLLKRWSPPFTSEQVSTTKYPVGEKVEAPAKEQSGITPVQPSSDSEKASSTKQESLAEGQSSSFGLETGVDRMISGDYVALAADGPAVPSDVRESKVDEYVSLPTSKEGEAITSLSDMPTVKSVLSVVGEVYEQISLSSLNEIDRQAGDGLSIPLALQDKEKSAHPNSHTNVPASEQTVDEQLVEELTQNATDSAVHSHALPSETLQEPVKTSQGPPEVCELVTAMQGSQKVCEVMTATEGSRKVCEVMTATEGSQKVYEVMTATEGSQKVCEVMTASEGSQKVCDVVTATRGSGEACESMAASQGSQRAAERQTTLLQEEYEPIKPSLDIPEVSGKEAFKTGSQEKSIPSATSVDPSSDSDGIYDHIPDHGAHGAEIELSSPQVPGGQSPLTESPQKEVSQEEEDDESPFLSPEKGVFLTEPCLIQPADKDQGAKQKTKDSSPGLGSRLFKHIHWRKESQTSESKAEKSPPKGQHKRRRGSSRESALVEMNSSGNSETEAVISKFPSAAGSAEGNLKKIAEKESKKRKSRSPEKLHSEAKASKKRSPSGVSSGSLSYSGSKTTSPVKSCDDSAVLATCEPRQKSMKQDTHKSATSVFKFKWRKALGRTSKAVTSRETGGVAEQAPGEGDRRSSDLDTVSTAASGSQESASGQFSNLSQTVSLALRGDMNRNFRDSSQEQIRLSLPFSMVSHEDDLDKACGDQVRNFLSMPFRMVSREERSNIEGEAPLDSSQPVADGPISSEEQASSTQVEDSREEVLDHREERPSFLAQSFREANSLASLKEGAGNAESRSGPILAHTEGELFLSSPVSQQQMQKPVEQGPILQPPITQMDSLCSGDPQCEANQPEEDPVYETVQAEDMFSGDISQQPVQDPVYETVSAAKEVHHSQSAPEEDDAAQEEKIPAQTEVQHDGDHQDTSVMDAAGLSEVVAHTAAHLYENTQSGQDDTAAVLKASKGEEEHQDTPALNASGSAEAVTQETEHLYVNTQSIQDDVAYLSKPSAQKEGGGGGDSMSASSVETRESSPNKCTLQHSPGPSSVSDEAHLAWRTAWRKKSPTLASTTTDKREKSYCPVICCEASDTPCIHMQDLKSEGDRTPESHVNTISPTVPSTRQSGGHSRAKWDKSQKEPDYVRMDIKTAQKDATGDSKSTGQHAGYVDMRDLRKSQEDASSLDDSKVTSEDVPETEDAGDNYFNLKADSSEHEERLDALQDRKDYLGAQEKSSEASEENPEESLQALEEKPEESEQVHEGRLDESLEPYITKPKVSFEAEEDKLEAYVEVHEHERKVTVMTPEDKLACEGKVLESLETPEDKPVEQEKEEDSVSLSACDSKESHADKQAKSVEVPEDIQTEPPEMQGNERAECFEEVIEALVDKWAELAKMHAAYEHTLVESFEAHEDKQAESSDTLEDRFTEFGVHEDRSPETSEAQDEKEKNLQTDDVKKTPNTCTEEERKRTDHRGNRNAVGVANREANTAEGFKVTESFTAYKPEPGSVQSVFGTFQEITKTVECGESVYLKTPDQGEEEEEKKGEELSKERGKWEGHGDTEKLGDRRNQSKHTGNHEQDDGNKDIMESAEKEVGCQEGKGLEQVRQESKDSDQNTGKGGSEMQENRKLETTEMLESENSEFEGKDGGDHDGNKDKNREPMIARGCSKTNSPQEHENGAFVTQSEVARVDSASAPPGISLPSDGDKSIPTAVMYTSIAQQQEGMITINLKQQMSWHSMQTGNTDSGGGGDSPPPKAAEKVSFSLVVSPTERSEGHDGAKLNEKLLCVEVKEHGPGKSEDIEEDGFVMLSVDDGPDELPANIWSVDLATGSRQEIRDVENQLSFTQSLDGTSVYEGEVSVSLKNIDATQDRAKESEENPNLMTAVDSDPQSTTKVVDCGSEFTADAGLSVSALDFQPQSTGSTESESSLSSAHRVTSQIFEHRSSTDCVLETHFLLDGSEESTTLLTSASLSSSGIAAEAHSTSELSQLTVRTSDSAIGSASLTLDSITNQSLSALAVGVEARSVSEFSQARDCTSDSAVGSSVLTIGSSFHQSIIQNSSVSSGEAEIVRQGLQAYDSVVSSQRDPDTSSSTTDIASQSVSDASSGHRIGAFAYGIDLPEEGIQKTDDAPPSPRETCEAGTVGDACSSEALVATDTHVYQSVELSVHETDQTGEPESEKKDFEYSLTVTDEATQEFEVPSASRDGKVFECSSISTDASVEMELHSKTLSEAVKIQLHSDIVSESHCETVDVSAKSSQPPNVIEVADEEGGNFAWQQEYMADFNPTSDFIEPCVNEENPQLGFREMTYGPEAGDQMVPEFLGSQFQESVPGLLEPCPNSRLGAQLQVSEQLPVPYVMNVPFSDGYLCASPFPDQPDPSMAPVQVEQAQEFLDIQNNAPFPIQPVSDATAPFPVAPFSDLPPFPVEYSAESAQFQIQDDSVQGLGSSQPTEMPAPYIFDPDLPSSENGPCETDPDSAGAFMDSGGEGLFVGYHQSELLALSAGEARSALMARFTDDLYEDGAGGGDGQDALTNNVYEAPPHSNESEDEDEDADTYQSPPSNKPVCEPPPDMLYQVEATHAYTGEDEDELHFEAGDIIYVVKFENEDEQDDGWQMGILQKSGAKGVFPENFTRKI